MADSELPSELERLERDSLAVVLAYYAGEQPLDAAVRAILAVSEHPAPRAAEGQDAEDAEEQLPPFDTATMPPEMRLRFEALARALDEHLRDTA